MIPGISFDNDRKPLRTKTEHELGGSPKLVQAIPDQTGSMPVKVGMNPASSVQRQSVIEMRFLGGMGIAVPPDLHAYTDPPKKGYVP